MELNRSSDTMDLGLTVIVDKRPLQFVLLQMWELLQSPRLAHEVARLQDLATGHQIVHLDTGPVVRHLPPPTNKTKHYF